MTRENDMRSFGECLDQATECQFRAKIARKDEDRQSWLALADSWLQTAELKAKLDMQRKQAA